MLQFTDCPQCAKRIRTDAVKCHHCGTAIPTELAEVLDVIDGSPEFAVGGYTDEDFDYDEFVESEFGSRPRRRIGWLWYIVAWLLVVLLLAGSVLSF